MFLGKQGPQTSLVYCFEKAVDQTAQNGLIALFLADELNHMVEYFLNVFLSKLSGPALKRPVILGVLTVEIKEFDIRSRCHFLARNDSGIIWGI